MVSDGHIGAQFRTRDGVRNVIRDAQVGQRARAEEYSRGYKSEEQSFYGHSNRPQAAEAEDRFTMAYADNEHAKNRRYEQEQEEAYNQSHSGMAGEW